MASNSRLTGPVRIATTLKYSGGRAAGTGMVLTSDGEVVTNHHVVVGATSIKVTVMATGATYDDDGEVVGTTTAASSSRSDVIGYAVPIAKVLSIADDLESGIAKARYDYAYGVPGVGLGGTTATVQGVYTSAVGAHSPGDSLGLSWTDADGTSHSATLTLAQGPMR